MFKSQRPTTTRYALFKGLFYAPVQLGAKDHKKIKEIVT